MLGDTLKDRFHADFMEAGLPYITLSIDSAQAIEIGDFVSAFTSLASQYDKFIRAHYPDFALVCLLRSGPP